MVLSHFSFLQTVPLLTITFMLSCSCQVDSVLNTVTTTLGEAAIYGERQETRVAKVFPLENQTRVTKSLFISNTELQNLNIMQINQLFRCKSI